MARKASRKRAAPKRARPAKKTKEVDDYRHEETTRPNNPPAGLAWQDTKKPKKRTFSYDPHLDPQLVWSGKAERTSFEVEAASIHVHERISTEAILRVVKKEAPQLSLFETPELEPAKLIEFYEHEMNWVNRLVLGDSLVVMTSLLEKERLGGRVQMIYIDPPYGINYNSNFQARISDKTPRETEDSSLTREPEQVQAYRDTWSLHVHSYLAYLRDRLQAGRDLLTDSGSVFVQIGEDNTHRVRLLLDEVLGAKNHVATISVQKSGGLGARLLPVINDYVLWYSKDRSLVRYRQLYRQRDEREPDPTLANYTRVELPDGTRRQMVGEEIEHPAALPHGARRYALDNLMSQGFRSNTTVEYEFEGQTFHPGNNRCWKTTVEGLDTLAENRRLEVSGKTLWYVRFADDLPGRALNNVWTDTSSSFASDKRYVVQTNPKIITRCLLMTTDPGDLILDPTCGSGTTAYVAEQFGRRWITCDTSRVALALARERILTAVYPFYSLLDDARGVDGGLVYKQIRRITLGSIARKEAPEQVALVDQPEVTRTKVRVSGPFTVEALSRYSVNPMQDEVPPEPGETDEGADHVTTLLDALKARGIPRREGKPIPISSLQRITNTGPVQAEGAFEDSDGKERSFAVSLGPRFGPITVAQIDEALHDAYGYDLVVFAGFAVDAAAQQYVAKGKLGKFNVALLEANPDLLVGDLLKSTPSSQTFRLFASPDAQVKKQGKEGVTVELLGVDAFDAATGDVASHGQRDVSAWFLDQDYDGIVFHVCQAFFPKTSGFDALERALKGTLDRELLETLATFESMPFKPGGHKRAAIRVVDDFGSTSEAVLELK